MQDDVRVGKFIRLFGNIFFSFVFFLVFIVGMIFILKLFFGMLDRFSYTEIIYRLCLTMVPAVFFLMVNGYYWARTRSVLSTPVRYISYILFAIMMIGWLYVLVKDVILFFKYGYQDINKYMSFSLLMLGGSVFLIFLVGIIQALAAPEEKERLY